MAKEMDVGGSGIAVVLAVALFVAVVASVLLLARRRGRQPKAGPEMAALPRPSRRIVARAVRRGELVPEPQLARAAVEHARRLQGSFALVGSKPFVVLAVVVGALMVVGGVIELFGYDSDGGMPVLSGAWLVAMPWYSRWQIERARRAEALNRELTGS